MYDLQKQISDLKTNIYEAAGRIELDRLLAERDHLQVTTETPDFWSDSAEAQRISKHYAKLDARIKPWLEVRNSADELEELVDLGDDSLKADIQKQYEACLLQFDSLKTELKYSGLYDDHDVILNIYAGAGGTDAQDWASMLHRMYVRWAERSGLQVETLDLSAGEEAGLKSVMLEITGAFAYGKLKGEHGVHRLVRLSPFNSDNLRQTSFAKVDLLPKIERSDSLNIDEKELKIDVYRAGGHGGQSVNTTDSAVRITHIPTGITVAIQNERSQLQNKETAMTIIRSRLAQLQMEQHAEKIAELKGPNQSAEWGNQIRSYVLHPYKQVKDLRTRHETSDPEGVLDGDLDGFIDAYSEHVLGIHD